VSYDIRLHCPACGVHFETHLAPSHADAPSDGIAQCLRQTVSASSATGETISALRLAKAWLEEDEGRRLEDVIRIDNECRGHNGKGAFNERYVEMCRAVVNACGGTSDGRCADKP
jgi:glucose-6-phosphate isomerase